ncbi:MAG: RNA methyltransferase [Ignavibacteria bacterium GWB2_35_12]|nr:MAG: RNA methyltransferase [Ignavibacteria bacterium GWB2_35_12]OGU96807.1 MAG: RNA methyltransferase [Ignavibacteria bacterium RIFOXYA2_FULL_35_10]OGV18807.1 MAG: RNA methyltransferase [Ignavibacteria bacterium RIFOXYC2_FULL_35_21]
MKKLLHSEILKERLTAEESLSIDRHPISLMIVNVRSLYNVGSIFRTADSARLSQLILCGYTPYPPRKEIDKTALGATESVPWKYYKTAKNAISELKSKGIKVIAVEITDKKRSYDTLTKSDFPLCLVLGNELTGLDDKVLSECDDAIEIPMFGVKHSLNVSVAAGIVTFEAVRIWKQTL